MRICIFAHARSGSNFLRTTLAHQYKLQDLYEIFDSEQNNNTDPFEIMKKDDIVFKIMAHDFFTVSFDSIDWNSFDQVWVIERKNLVDALCSNFIASHTNLFSGNPPPPRQKFIVDLNYFVNWIKQIDMFFEIKSKILKLVKNVNLVYYEDIMVSQENSSIFMPSNFNYKADCENYKELEKKFEYYKSKSKRID